MMETLHNSRNMYRSLQYNSEQSACIGLYIRSFGAPDVVIFIIHIIISLYSEIVVILNFWHKPATSGNEPFSYPGHLGMISVPSWMLVIETIFKYGKAIKIEFGEKHACSISFAAVIQS